MKRINLTAFIATTKLTLVLMCLIFTVFTLKTSAQQKTTCTVDGKVFDDCTRLPNGNCLLYGQLQVKCTAQPQPRCADGGPLIIKLNKAGTFYERSTGYHDFDDNLRCRELNIGFFGAARDITWDFFVDEKLKIYTGGVIGGFPDKADTFLGLASNQLVRLNTSEFAEIISTRKLSVIDDRGFVTYLTDPVAIDFELVRREQAVVQQDLIQTGSDALPIVLAINARINGNLDYARYIQAPLSPTMRAIAQVRDNKRILFNNANAIYDYGDMNDRMAVGLILATQHRK